MKRLYLSFLFLFLIFNRLSAQTITGSVADKITGRYLSGASVLLYQRIVDTLPDGTLELKSIAAATQVAATISNDQGQFSAKFNLSKPTYYYARFTLQGYEEMLYTLVRLDPGSDAFIPMSMCKSALTPSESIQLQQVEDARLLINNNAKNEEWLRIQSLDNATEPSHASHQQRAACTYTVPTTFYVKNLSNGYNSYSCPSSGTFTGNMPQDEYIGGCVAGEMGSSFPAEAQKTQAVCARTYALKRQNAGSGANCGQAYSFTVCSSCTTASVATTNQVMTYNGSLIEALYAARCNGSYTETASPSGCNAFTAFPYLVCTTCSGHTDCQTAGEPCTSCTNACTNSASKVYGHGVGMCQRGSQGFANAGQPYTWILNHFYSGICLANTSATPPANDNCSGAIQLISNTSCTNTTSTVNDATADNLPVPACDLYTPAANILGAGVFFKFTALSTSHTIKVTPTGNLDALLVVYKGSNCTSLQEIGCIDQSGGAGVVTSLTVNNLTINQQYWIRVYDYGSANTTAGGFNICVTHQPCITPSAAASITSSGSSYCTGQNPITLTANGTLTTGAKWKWYSTSCGGTAIDTGNSIQVTPSAATTYYLRAESTCGNSTCISKQINVTQPAPAPTITASGPTTLCGNQTVDISITNPCSGCSFVWSNGSNANSITADTSGSFYVTQNSSCGGLQQSASISVTKSSPVASASANPPSVIPGATSALQGSGGINCSWSIAGSASFSSSCTTSVIPAQTTTYDLLVTDANGCTSVAQTVVSVIPIGCTYAVSPQSISTDSNGTIATVIVSTTGTSCPWKATPSDCGFISLQNDTGINSGSFIVSIPATSDSITNTCIINVNGQLITITQTGKTPKGSSPACNIDTAITLNGNCKLTAKNIPGATYKWFSDGVEIQGALSRVYNAVENAVYNVLITDGSCSAIGSDWYLNCLPSSLDDIDDSGVSIFPNPSNGTFRIEAVSGGEVSVTIAVFNALGQKVYEEHVQPAGIISHEIGLGNASTGIYTLQLKAGTNVVSKKLLIQH